MASEPNEYRPLHLSTEQLPVEDRVSIWREEFGRQILRLDIEPIPDAPFHADIKVYPLPTLSAVSITASGMREKRTRELISDGNDAIGLVVNLSGPFIASADDREVSLGTGDAVLISCPEPGCGPSIGRAFGLSIPHAALASIIPNVEDRFGKLIPQSLGLLGLLASYLSTLTDPRSLAEPAFRELATTHLYDLLALALGAKREVMEVAEERGISAARLRAIKVDILNNLGSRDLSLNALAARHRVTPRYVQRLFEREGTSLTDFILSERLARVHLLLRDTRHAQRTISDIAFEVGFGDLSYFNRAFRRRFGMTPSDLREACRSSATNERPPPEPA